MEALECKITNMLISNVSETINSEDKIESIVTIWVVVIQTSVFCSNQFTCAWFREYDAKWNYILLIKITNIKKNTLEKSQECLW